MNITVSARLPPPAATFSKSETQCISHVQGVYLERQPLQPFLFLFDLSSGWYQSVGIGVGRGHNVSWAVCSGSTRPEHFPLKGTNC